jgi:Holliday junction resolvasome RuvABC endonuclease subunit
MIALGIDCATKTGWALVERTSGRERLLESGCLLLSGKNPGVWVTWLREERDGPQPDVVAIELPWLGKNPHTLEVLARLCGRFEQAFSGTPTRVIRAVEWQSKMIGRKLGGKTRDGLKKASKLVAGSLFGRPLSEDESDAALMATFALRFPV